MEDVFYFESFFHFLNYFSLKIMGLNFGLKGVKVAQAEHPSQI